MKGEFCEDLHVKPQGGEGKCRTVAVAFIVGISLIFTCALYLQVRTLDSRLAETEEKLGDLLYLYREVKITHAVDKRESHGDLGNEIDETILANLEVTDRDVAQADLRRFVRSADVGQRKGRRRRTGGGRTGEGRAGEGRRAGRCNNCLTTDVMSRWAEVFETAFRNDFHVAAHVILDDGYKSGGNVAGVSLYWTAQDGGNTMIGMDEGITLLDDNLALSIPTDGVYVIYNQITFVGRDESQGRLAIDYPHCGQLIKVDRLNGYGTPGNGTDVLLYGSTTQYRLGRRVTPKPTSDSVYMSGVFRLQAGNRLSVELDAHSFTSKCKIRYHHDKSYFGIYRLKAMPIV